MTEAMAWKIGYRQMDPTGIPEALWAAYWRGVHAGQEYRNYRSVLAQGRLLD